MRFRSVCALISSFLSWPLALSGAGGRATVKVESAPVYSQRNASAEVVKSLQKGDPVDVGMTLSGEDGEWCSVKEPDQKTSLGYMRCEHLAREQRTQPVIIAPEPAAPPATPRPPAVAGPAQPTRRYGPMDGGENYIRLVRTWAGWPPPLSRADNLFDFTAEQQAQVEALANQTGVTGCRQQVDAFYRRYAHELAAPSLRPTPAEKQAVEKMGQAFNRFGYPCMMKMQELMEQLPALMTPDQQRAKAVLLAPYKKDLADMRKVLTRPNRYPGIY